MISYAVGLYFRFPLSLRMVEELLAARGIESTDETVRRWALKFGATLDMWVQSRRDRHAARWLMRKHMKQHGRVPRVLVTDELRSYAAVNQDFAGLDSR